MTSASTFWFLPTLLGVVGLIAALAVVVVACMTLLAARRRLRAAAAIDELRYRRMLDEEIAGTMPTGAIPPTGTRD